MAIEVFFYVLISLIVICGLLGGIFIYLITVLIVGFSIFGLYQKNTNKFCESRRRLEGKTIVVTGGTAGMGIKIATDLVARGAKVIITSPFENEAAKAIKYITEKSEEDNIVYKKLDLASFDNIRKFATDILSTEDRLDILINNAGINEGDVLTDDGINKVMQVNYYGTFLLTLLLLPLLKKTGNKELPSRIINTTSLMRKFGSVDFENMNKIGRYRWQTRSYANSKLCVLYFTHTLAKRLEGCNVVVNCVDPGAVGTKILNTAAKGVFGQFLIFLTYFLCKSPWEGSQTALHAVLDRKAAKYSGELFQNCEISKSKITYDEGTAEILWKESIKLVSYVIISSLKLKSALMSRNKLM